MTNEAKDSNSGNRNSGDMNSGYMNSGYMNSGDMNSGDRNSGDMNSGYMNSGDMNSGNRNSGNRNSGDMNSGNMNSGYMNSGDMNSGDMNSGDRNSGNRNSGDMNSGDRNSGDMNSGDRNSGDMNSGYMNSGNRNSGYLCVGTPKPMIFDKPCDLTWDELESLVPYVELPCGVDFIYSADMSEKEKTDFPNHVTLGGYLKYEPMLLVESFPIAWANMSDEEKLAWMSLPNFDAEKFLTITGVDVRKESPSVPEKQDHNRCTINGVEYFLVPVIGSE